MATEVMGTVEAAAYLGCAVVTLKKHMERGNLKADKKIGKSLIFTRATLDNFKKNKRNAWRPRKV